jgi:hypothetical protein
MRPPAAGHPRTLVAGLTLVTLAGAAAFVVGLVGSLSFFGRGADEEFRAWADRPLLLAGPAAVLFATAGLTASRVTRTRRPGTSLAVAATLLGAGVLVAGVVAHHARLHPQSAQRTALRELAVPPRRATDRVSVGSAPAGSALVAGPPGHGPPVAVRSWSPATCADLHGVLASWSDRGSLEVPASFRPGPGRPCLWFATHDSYAVRGELWSAPLVATSTATVVISPPGVGP